VNQTTILRHAFQYCDGMEAFLNFRLVSKSWKLAVENTKFYSPRVQDILIKIAEKFGQGGYPIIYHKLLQNLKTNPSRFLFHRVSLSGSLSNNFNSIAKLISQNMKGLRSISIGNNSDVIGNEIFEKFLIKFLPNSKNTLCELNLPNLFLPNVCYPNLTKLTVGDLPLSFDVFKTEFEQILKNVPDLKVIEIERQNTITPSIRNYMISNYAEQCLVSYEGNIPFPVKIIHGVNFNQLISDCEFKFCVEYAEIYINSEYPDDLFIRQTEASWNNFKNNIYDFSKLKGIHFYDCEYTFYDLEESTFNKPETNVEPELETFYNIWPNRIQFLKSHGIQILNRKEFYSKKEELSKNIKLAFHFGHSLYHQ